MKKTLQLSLVLAALMCLGGLIGCSSAGNTIEKDEKLTVAKAQKEIKVGMSSAEVVEVLGSPNMVTTDEQRRETWVYDRMSTQVDGSSSSQGVWLLVVGAGGSKASTKSSQRTLTIIVKFDEQGKVRDFAYRSSSF